MPKQKITAAEKQNEIEALGANPKDQVAQIQKMSDQLEASTRAQQMVVSNR